MGIFDVAPQPVQNPQIDEAAQTYRQAAQVATPSVQSLDTAAARVRSRMAGTNRANEMSIRDRFASAGRQGSGGFNQAMSQNSAANSNALASAYTDLELGFEDRKNQYAQTLSQIGQGQGQLGLGVVGAGVDLAGIGKNYQSQKEGQDLNKYLTELEIGKTEEEGIRRAILSAVDSIYTSGNTQLGAQGTAYIQNLMARLFGLTPVDNPETIPPIPPVTGGGGGNSGGGIGSGGGGTGGGYGIG